VTPRDPAAGPADSSRADSSRADASRADASRADDLAAELVKIARGDATAFEKAYDEMAAPVFGIVKRVIRDPAQSEEVTQEVLLEVWRTAYRFDQAKGSAMAWIMTLAHRRAVDRVRSAQKEAERERRVATAAIPFDEVAETVETNLEHERVRRCLGSLTPLQREAVTLAYYGGYTYPQVAELLGVALGTIKTRIRDGLIRMRDCMEVTR
jgi:RNA polymerase sigma-70 factor (ECF subfamily)